MFVGLATLDVVHHVDAAPGPDAKATAGRQDIGAGGPATGAALAFAALGGRATLLTLLGGSPVAALIRADLGRVAVLDAAPDGSQWTPPVSAVRVGPTGRSITSPDAALAPRPVDPLPLLPGAGVVLVDGHHPGLARAGAAHATATATPLLLDLGRAKPVFDHLLPRTDVVVASADHAGRAGELLAAGPAAVAVTAGAGPVAWATAAGVGDVVVPPVDVVDTLGAGDVFHGAVAFAIACRGVVDVVAHWPDVLAWASAVAAVRVTTVGPHAWRTDPRMAELARG